MKVFGKSLAREKPEILVPPCPHTATSARWASIEDKDKPDKVSSYVCTGCDEILTPLEVSLH